MLLYLVQHGLSTPKQVDPNRPLTEQGSAEVEKIAGFLTRTALLTVDRIVHSGKLRARQTAELMAEAFHPQGGVEPVGGLAPMDDPAIWAEEIMSETGSLMLVGHLPHLSRLAGQLITLNAGTTAVNFKNAGVVCLERSLEGDWAVNWVVTPALLT